MFGRTGVITPLAVFKEGKIVDGSRISKATLNNADIIRKLVKEQVDYKCVNEECPAIKMQKIIYFASKNCMNIEGLRRKYNKRFN